MTALLPPAPDAPAEEWGALAVSLTGWRWMPGMRALDTGLRLDEMTDDWEASLPDPDDPATAGCLLALLGTEVWRIGARDDGYLILNFRHGIAYWDADAPGGWVSAASLGRACIAAAAANGRWPGGEG